MVNGGHWARDWVALVLAIGVAVALNLIIVAALWVAIDNERFDAPVTLSENATQVIAGFGGAMIGAVSSYLGFRAGERRRDGKADSDEN